MFLRALPDLHFTIEDIRAEGDTVVACLTACGTHQGELLGILPTNGQITISAVEVYRLAGGKIAEHSVIMDTLRMLQQLGALLIPSQPGV